MLNMTGTTTVLLSMAVDKYSTANDKYSTANAAYITVARTSTVE